MTIERSYIAGVLHGDGYLTNLALGIMVKDKDFADAFAEAVLIASGVRVKVTRDKTYWKFVTSNKSGRFNDYKDFTPKILDEKAAWIRGLFDSEGNAQLSQVNGKRSYIHRRVSIYSTNFDTLVKAKEYLLDLGINVRTRATKNSASHKGTLIVYELALRGFPDFTLFENIVGSKIERKRAALAAIVSSAAIPGYERRAQLLGAAARRHKTMTVTLPRVIEGIRSLINAGIKPTQRNCRVIPGYCGIQKLVPQARLVHFARQNGEI